MKLRNLIVLASIAALTACTSMSENSIHRNAQVSALNLTPDEEKIWVTLTPEQQNRAIAFIQNGGTLVASLGDK